MATNHFFFSNLMLYNLGCEAILRGTLTILQRTCQGEVEVTMPSYRAAPDRQRLADLNGIHIEPMSQWQGLKRVALRKLKMRHWIHPRFRPSLLDSPYRAALSVGGDLYTFALNTLHWDLIGLEQMCQQRKIPFIIWGATLESFEKRPDLLPLLLEHLHACTLITVRDRKSREYLARHGVTDNVVEVFDPAFCMEPIACDIEPYLPNQRGDLCIGVNLSPLAQRYYPTKERFIHEIARGCEQFIEQTGGSVVLVSHVFTPEPRPSYDDKAFHDQIFQEINPRYRERVGVTHEDIGAPRMKYLISTLDAYAGTRMHSTIAALSCCVPTLALAYSDKAIGLNNMFFDDERWILRIPSLDAKSLSAKLIELCDHRGEVRAFLESRIDQVKAKSQMAGNVLLERLA